MKNLYPILISSLICIASALNGQEGPVGWASFGNGTTGGAGGDTVIVTNRSELAIHAASQDTLVIMFEDTIEMSAWERMDVLSNKSIIGMGYNATLRFGGFEIKGDNVIIQNIAIVDSYDGDWSGETHSTDAITIYGTNVWVDHCELAAGADGLFDIRADNGIAANFITLSYTRLSNHNKVMLIGSSDNETEDRGKLKTTIHHCWFDGTVERGLNQRMPRTRFGDVHLFNNYFERISSYCSAARFESDLVIEGNYYRMSLDPHFRDDIGLGIEDPEIKAYNNIYELSSGRKESVGEAFNPSTFYMYAPDSTYDVPAIVMNEAGRFDRPGNVPPVAATDTLMLDGTGGLKIIEATLNDTDSDGGVVKIARVVSTSYGISQVRDNTILYVKPPDDVPRDTILYQIVDTQGGVDTGMVLVLSEISSTGNPEANRVELSISPNPLDSQGWVTLRGENLDPDMIEITVLDVQGNLIDSVVQTPYDWSDRNEVRAELRTSSLPAGMYVLSVAHGNSSNAQTFVVMH